eukprot:COSAG05_NODE_2965_length_2458_cov_4.126325_1_plen_96_part_00
MVNNDTALLILNRQDSQAPGNISIDFDDLYTSRYSNPTPALAYSIRDMWSKRELGVATCCITISNLASHASRFLRLTPMVAKQYECDSLKFCSQV